MTPRTCGLVLVLLLGACGERHGSYRPIQEVPSGNSLDPCTPTELECRIYWTDAGEISGREAPPGLEPLGGMPAIDSRRRVYLPSSSPGRLIVWNLDGSVEKVLGSEGEGPGEMLGLTAAWTSRGDTVHVRDSKGTWSVFAPEGEFVRKSSAGLPVPMYMGMTAEGVAVDGQGKPLFRILGPNGEQTAAFGHPGPGEELPRRRISSGNSGHFWASPTHEIALTKWDLNGNVLDSLRLSHPLFPEQETDRVWDSSTGEAPPANVTHIAEDGEGRLWIRVMVPAGDFEPVPAAAPGATDASSVVDVTNAAYDFLVLVVAAETGRTIASATAATMGDGLSGLLPGGWGFRIYQNELGFQRYEFGQLRLGR